MLVLDAEGGYQPVGEGNTLVRRARRHARLGAAIGCASLLLVVLLASRDRSGSGQTEAALPPPPAAATADALPLKSPPPAKPAKPPRGNVTFATKPSIVAPECAAADNAASIEGCLAVSQACLDQGEVVMMGEEYQPDLLHPAWAPGAVAPLPRFEPHWSVVYNMQYSNGESNQDFITGAQPQMGPVTFRARSWLDDSPDLQHPQFDNSTTPVVLHPVWQFNYGHTATASIAWIYNNLNQLVVRTPHGWGLPPFVRPLLQPLLRKPITTFAELSQRPAVGSKNGSPRCYCRLLFCNGYRATESPNAWSAAQAVAAAYAPPNKSTTRAQPPPQLQLPGQGGAAQQQAAAARSIVFHRRSAHSRQLANLQELVDRCSQWGWAAAAAGQGRSSTQQGAGGATQSRLSCSSHLFGDVPASVAAAQAADVFIGTHGANLANSFFMQPGSAMVEVIHPGWARIVHMFDWMLKQDPKHELIYFGLVVNASAWTPGVYEEQQRAAGLRPYRCEPNGLWRDRNVHLKWEWLEEVLARIAALNGNVTAWRQLAVEDYILHVV